MIIVSAVAAIACEPKIRSIGVVSKSVVFFYGEHLLSLSQACGRVFEWQKTHFQHWRSPALDQGF